MIIYQLNFNCCPNITTLSFVKINSIVALLTIEAREYTNIPYGGFIPGLYAKPLEHDIALYFINKYKNISRCDNIKYRVP